MKWNDNVDGFVSGLAEVEDAEAFVEALRSVPEEKWQATHARLTERLDNLVPGEPTPPLTDGEEIGKEVLSADELAEEARTIEGKRALLARENERRKTRA